MRLSDVIYGDCPRASLRILEAKNTSFEERTLMPGIGPRYLLLNLRTREIANGSSASGYDVNMEIFRALCPRTAPPPEVYVPPPEPPGRDKDPDVNQTARSAWAKAVSLAKERNAGRTCKAEAYKSTIISQLEVAARLYPPFQGRNREGQVCFSQGSPRSTRRKHHALPRDRKDEQA